MSACLKLPYLAAALLALACLPALADDDDWMPVPPERLAALRGGFTTPSGLELLLGIERIVSVNGEAVSHLTMVALGSSGSLAGAESARLIQQGGNNVFGGALDQTGATFIQNSLSNQIIRTDTVISASVNSAGLLRELNLGQAWQQAALAAAH